MMMINISGIGAAAGLEAPAVRAQPQQAGAMKLAAMPSAMATMLAALLMLTPGLAGCSRNGQGTKTFPDGGTYTGEFKDDLPNGQGTFTDADGDTYTGEWKDGEFNGQGTYTFANGRKYTGEFKDNLFNGQGTMTFAEGTTYTGYWMDGKLLR